MGMNTRPEERLIELCTSLDFDVEEAAELISKADLNEVFEYSDDSEETDDEFIQTSTYLGIAVSHLNVRMVQLLLEHGADPNLFTCPEFNSDNVFWWLHADNGETKEENDIRLEIARMMLEHGADTRIVSDGEELFSYVNYLLAYEDERDSEIFRYHEEFLRLLAEYDAEGGIPEGEYYLDVLADERTSDSFEEENGMDVPTAVKTVTELYKAIGEAGYDEKTVKTVTALIELCKQEDKADFLREATELAKMKLRQNEYVDKVIKLPYLAKMLPNLPPEE